MKNAIMLATVVAATLPASAFAQEVSGVATLGYGHTDISDVSNNIHALTFDGRMGIDFKNGVSIGLRADTIRGRISGFDGHATGTVFGAEGVYTLPSRFRVGGYYEQGSVDVTGLPITLSATSYGVMGGYDFGAGKVDGFYGRTTTSPDIGAAGIGVHDYGVVGSYGDGSKWRLGGTLMQTRISAYGSGYNVTLVGLAGTYQVNNDWTVFGGVAHINQDDLNLSGTNVGLGVSYDLSGLTKFASTVSFEYEHSHGDFSGSTGNANTFRLGWTIPFGGAKASVPLNSVADSILSPTHSVITSTVLSTF